MPVHDWARVAAGIFHHFHNAWMMEISNACNNGLLPTGYYALVEQHAGACIADVLTLQAGSQAAEPSPPADTGGVAVAEAAPRVRRTLTAAGSLRRQRKTLAIRHVSQHRLVAMLEVVSPANKDRPAHVAEFVDKMEDAISHGVHALVADLVRPGKHDPRGIPWAIWQRLEGESYDLPPGEPLTLASYVADSVAKVYLEHVAIGSALPEMPLFLSPDRYVNLPLEATYQAAYNGVPGFWRDVLEGH